MSTKFNTAYWQSRYLKHQIGWDAGSITTPLKEYFEQLTNPELRILIPGCGNAYEAEYLFRNQFKNVYIADVVDAPLRNFFKRVPDFPEEQLLLQDFFDLTLQFDLIVEQTFFCALEPTLRSAYAQKCAQLLYPGSKLVGLLFDRQFEQEGPPFGGNAEEYRSYFEPYFEVVHFERAYNSIKPRKGQELFICLKKK
ncbi:TPMT family class I SAM-dependent methyltransferase [Pontibacter harenae]|uniref:TPMT family class I SAM-dependent methyltransferase n=1 Tax=Pontibacter harenae TaxID=2894083 RepID=UPI001E5E82D9|nr:TPMT family class I SAM-dependent methyltransferase [Pontibacter harenae]MCC9166563.1 TPMT family class I SAM-dependent methyltransferase [Pontibacter harenae]